jgi:ubiquinone/menaquinone biosynthesis C-methylase UbiE
MRPASFAPSSWDRFCTDYISKVFSPLQFAFARRQLIQEVKLPRVLDMGCGPTPFLLRDLLRLPDIDLFASDFSMKMLEAAKSQFPTGAIRFVFGDNRRLPFEDAFFHTVLSINSILPEQRDEIELMFAEVVRVLKPGGRFVALLPAFETSLMARDHWHMDIRVDTANHREYDTTGWQCFYTREDIADLMRRHGFAPYKLEPLYFDSEEAIAEIRKIYGQYLSPSLLREYPLFEHFLVADKPAQGASSISSW